MVPNNFINLSFAGRPDWPIFCQSGYFWRLIVIFWKDKVAERNGDTLSYFLFKQINYIFKLQKWFDVDILGFQIELCSKYFNLFLLANCLCYL
jgi:hypothetical protein